MDEKFEKICIVFISIVYCPHSKSVQYQTKMAASCRHILEKNFPKIDSEVFEYVNGKSETDVHHSVDTVHQFKIS